MEKQPEEKPEEESSDEEKAERLVQSMRKIDFHFLANLKRISGNPFYEDEDDKGL